MNRKPRRPEIRTPLPGPKTQALLDRDAAAVSPSYTRSYPLAAARGEGCWIEDLDGNVFLDMAAGIAVCATGHCHPQVVEAIRDQAGRLIHMSGTDFYYEPQVELAERLAELAPGPGGKKVFFANSGAEAVECALKLARWHTERQLVVAFEGAFHGRTYGALSLTASKAIQKDRFFPLVPGVHHVPWGDAGAIERLLEQLLPPDELAAVFVEPIQGEGGYRLPPEGFLPKLRDICDRTGALLVVDEVQAGMGRTGKLFAIEHEGVLPDLICVAKGIASGLPLGACIAQAGIMDWPAGAHASTFGGNPIACRAALATLDLLEGGLVAQAADVGAELQGLLREAASGNADVVEVRGRGLMIAVEMREARLRDRVVDECFRRGLLVLGCGKKAVRFSPPLVLTAEEARVGAEIFAEALAAATA